MVSFRGKPSETHIIWTRETRDGAGNKRFDHNHFRKWAEHCGFDFETTTRVDHERAEEARQQYRCVFRWGKTDTETIEMGDEAWAMGSQRTPRTFVEIDEAGVARIQGWTFDVVLDVVMLRHKGPELFLESVDGEKKRLNARQFVQSPRKRQRKQRGD
ncbi:hypothetical protein ACKVMT_03915 [Halobacteriales archaeon Cl-PHB]